MKKLTLALICLSFLGNGAFATEYIIDGTGAGRHSSISFKASHVGISTLFGRFNDITGRFTYDAEDIGSSRIEVQIGTASIDTNHEARDEHLSTSDYLNVEQHPQARFVSTSVEDLGDGRVKVTGDLTLHGVTRQITLDAHRTGEGETPFGDYRVGFEGEAAIDAADFGINIFPTGKVELMMSIEGVRQ